MGGQASCYRLEYGGLDCPGEMFGTNAPASTWHMTFDHANLGPITYFVPVPTDSPLNRLGNGQSVPQPSTGNGNGNGNGNGHGHGHGPPFPSPTVNPTVNPTPFPSPSFPF
jgi:hypothetical protein